MHAAGLYIHMHPLHAHVLSNLSRLQVEMNADINACDGVCNARDSKNWSPGLTPAGLAQAHGHFR